MIDKESLITKMLFDPEIKNKFRFADGCNLMNDIVGDLITQKHCRDKGVSLNNALR